MSVPPIPPLVGFIGAGNMARALAGGLINSGWDRSRLILSDPDPAQREGVQHLGLEAHADNAAVAARADILVFAVKPQMLAVAARAVADAVQRRRPLIVSVAAGVRLDDLERWLGGNLPMVRTMPNTAVLVGAGACGMYANARVDQTMREQAESILRAVGVTVWVGREELLDAVTALSGSGPAYFFLMMEALEQAAIGQGLTREQARLLTLQTAYGAAKMALEGAEEPALLRRRVTSPGGTTEQAVKALEEGGLRPLFQNALDAAARRARELADLFGKNA
ncbi:MAG: pyrroline-5-carboxylate reductase [Gammaproteobacteria bacterium]|nr:MAG: pyrroline-5-carboxylate reductase [Gammaproteobacteria bacterium]